MTVYFFVDTFPKLSETFIVQQISGLIEVGYDVKIVADRLGNQTELQPLAKKHDLMSKLIVPTPENYILKLLPGLKFCLLHLRFMRRYQLKSLYHLFTLLQLPGLSALGLQEDDVVICNFGPNGIKAAQLRKLGVHFKFITIFHGFDMSSFLKAEPKNVYEDVFTYSSAILPISDYWSRKLRTLGCPPHKIRVYRMGVNLNDFKPNKGKGSTAFTFLSTGRFVEKKGFEYSIKAFAEIVSKLSPTAMYKIVGDGLLKDSLKHLCNELGVENRVELMGSQDSHKVKRLLEQADVFVVPSITSKNGDMEGIPVAMMEAQAMGVPVIATDHSGISEGLIPGKTGLLVTERNIPELAKAMERLYMDEKLRNQLGSGGRVFVASQFNAKAQDRELADLIAELHV